MRRALPMALLMAGCSQQVPDQNAGARLERAAIAAGVIRDPATSAVTGLYARDTDRVCVVPAADGYRIGASIDFGGGQQCSARGTAARNGETLQIDFGHGCGFDARLDGDRIVFPGRLPPGCDRLCTNRASLTALEVDLQSEAAAEASTLRDPRGRLLCER